MTSSHELFQRAKKNIPAGVNSPVRAFGAMGGDPVFFDHAQGAYLYSVDGKQYIDYVGSWGPMILGHAHPSVIQAVKITAEKSLSFGAPCALEVKLADKVCALMPSIEKIRMVSSGTEATMTAIRIARGFTQKNKIIKFEGCYHGHADCLLVKAGSGALTFGNPSSAGVTPGAAQDTLIAQFNDLASVEKAFQENKNEVAAIILEPVAGNMNCVSPEPQFLNQLRGLCDDNNCLLIFDEVMTGFRVALGGAQEKYNVKPDLTTLGKVIGGGMPVGAVGGRADIMDCLAPTGPVYQAGTLSGNPVTMAAGLKTLELISAIDFFKKLESNTTKLMVGLKTAAEKHNIPFAINIEGGMFGFLFSEKESISNFQEVMQCDIERFKKFFHSMLNKGVYFAPSAFEAGFISNAHSDTDIIATIAAADHAFATL